MNGPNPIFPLAGLGQTAPAQGDQTPEGGNTAFAENLTAALAASSLTAVQLQKPMTETPTISLQGGLVDGAAAPAAGEPVLGNGDLEADLLRPDGRVDNGSNRNVDINAHAGSTRQAQSKATPDGGSPTPDMRVADVEQASAGVEGLGLEPSAAAKSVAQGSRAEWRLEPDVTRHPQLVSVNAAVVPFSGVVPDQRVTDGGDRPVAVPPISNQGRQPQILPGIDETAPIGQSSQLVTRTLRDDAPLVGASVKQLPSSEEILADPSVGEEMRPARLALPASALAGEGQISAPSSLSGLQTIAHRMSVHPEQPLPLQPVTEEPALLGGDTSQQQEASSLMASRAESVLPVQRSSADARRQEAFSQGTRPLAAKADPSGPSEDLSPKGLRDTPSVNVNEAIGKSGPGAATNGTAQPSVLDGSLRPNADFNAFERPQPALAVEGRTLDSLRFEAASNLGQSRPQTPLAHAPAGAQIAMQIVRSLPEGVERFSVHLQPAELGSVDIQLNFEGGGRLSALITAERPETLELLQRDSRLLERSLGDSGLKLSSDGLSFALKQDHQQQQHGQSFQEQAQARQTAFQAGRAYDDTLDSEQAPSAMRVDGLRLLDIET